MQLSVCYLIIALNIDSFRLGRRQIPKCPNSAAREK